MFHLTQKAYDDLKDIAIYTQENWGKSQRTLYLKMMNDAFHELSVNPKLGTKIDDIRAGYFKYRIGSHMIFYRMVYKVNSGSAGSDRVVSSSEDALRHDDVQIVRILHQRMDVESHI